MKRKGLRPFKITYDRQVKMWVSHDPETDIWSQGETKEKAELALIEALRLVILIYQRNFRGRE